MIESVPSNCQALPKAGIRFILLWHAHLARGSWAGRPGHSIQTEPNSPKRPALIWECGSVLFDFALLCALASLREISPSCRTFHAKAQSRKEKPQSKTLLGMRRV